MYGILAEFIGFIFILFYEPRLVMNSVYLVHNFAFGFCFIERILLLSTTKYCNDFLIGKTVLVAILSLFSYLKECLVLRSAIVISNRNRAFSLGSKIQQSINQIRLYHLVLPRAAAGLTTRGRGRSCHIKDSPGLSTGLSTAAGDVAAETRTPWIRPQGETTLKKARHDEDTS